MMNCAFLARELHQHSTFFGVTLYIKNSHPTPTMFKFFFALQVSLKPHGFHVLHIELTKTNVPF